MSKYARTRKAICRISNLENWSVSRSYFKRNPNEIWKQSYKKFRKECVRIKQFTGSTDFLRYYPPCKWKDALKHFPFIWDVVKN